MSTGRRATQRFKRKGSVPPRAPVVEAPVDTSSIVFNGTVFTDDSIKRLGEIRSSLIQEVDRVLESRSGSASPSKSRRRRRRPGAARDTGSLTTATQSLSTKPSYCAPSTRAESPVVWGTLGGKRKKRGGAKRARARVPPPIDETSALEVDDAMLERIRMHGLTRQVLLGGRSRSMSGSYWGDSDSVASSAASMTGSLRSYGSYGSLGSYGSAGVSHSSGTGSYGSYGSYDGSYGSYSSFENALTSAASQATDVSVSRKPISRMYKRFLFDGPRRGDGAYQVDYKELMVDALQKSIPETTLYNKAMKSGIYAGGRINTADYAELDRMRLDQMEEPRGRRPSITSELSFPSVSNISDESVEWNFAGSVSQSVQDSAAGSVTRASTRTSRSRLDTTSLSAAELASVDESIAKSRRSMASSEMLASVCAEDASEVKKKKVTVSFPIV